MSAIPGKVPRSVRLCGCLVDLSPGEVPAHFRNPEVDMLEWRMDLSCRKTSVEAVEAALSHLADSDRLPVLATHRPVREGGSFDGPEEGRLALLQKAAAAGADWVDLEHDVSRETVDIFRSRGARVLLSHHDFYATPDASSLRSLVNLLASKGPHAIKIVTLAQHPEDNLRVLELIAFARDAFDLEAVAFCMGPLGKWSRAVSLLLGSPWTYVQLSGLGAAAPGQYTAKEMRALLFALEATSLP
jgi:3-dehydroquinate dehydratase type I